jgi:UDP-2,4-diacetamido-2,4,6-trideoxy-beta-L-altropyranose hydrolase
MAHPDPTDSQATLRLVTKLKPYWLVIDGYHFGPDYQKAARAAGVRVLVIDDTAHWPKYHADILLNQNLGAEKLQYHCDRDTELLLGARYVLLRTEFLKWRGWQREIPREARKVLVTMGGSDPDNVTLKVIRALRQVRVDKLEAVVVIGASNPRREALEAAIQSSAPGVRNHRVRLECSPTDMPELMAWADIAVSAGGSTSWELAFMGVPTICLVVADNQRAAMRKLAEGGATVYLWEASDLTARGLGDAVTRLLGDRRTRSEMTARGQKLVDGSGVFAVVRHLLDRTTQEAACEK